MKSKRNAIKRKNDLTFILLTALMVISMIIIVIYCDVKVWPCFEKLVFLQRGNEDKTLYDLAIGYVSAYVFYLIQVYIPDKERQKEEKIIRVPLRMVAYALLYNTIELILDFYNEVVHEKYSSKDLNQSELTTQIINASKEIELYEPHKSPFQADSWAAYTLYIMRKVEKNIIRLVDNYHDILPTWIIDDLMYLNNESYYVGKLKVYVEDHCPDILEVCFPAESPGGDTKATLDETVRILGKILRWLKNERKELLKFGKTPKGVYGLCFWLHKSHKDEDW